MDPEKPLTPREIEILTLIAAGLTNVKIAARLNLSKYTVETHRKNINSKLGVNSTAMLLMAARKKNMI